MSSKRHDEAVEKALADFAAAEPTIDGRWKALRDVLAWLYASEELHVNRLGDNAYYAARDASAEGRTLAGLIWVRGEITHHDVPIEFVTTVQAELFRRTGAATATKLEVYRWPDGRSTPVSLHVTSTCWRPRAELPPPARKEKRGRDLAYDAHVASRPLLEPLEEAVRYLRTLSF